MYNFSFQHFLKPLFSIIVVLFANNFLAAQKIKGYVFVDSNNNSIMDAGEKGLGGVMVSNQKEVEITDEKGYFQIKLIEGNFIFVTKPESYQFKLDEFYNPKFYFLYKTEETKEQLKYPGIEPISEIPEVLYFPVNKNPGEDEHSCLLLGDLQMGSDKALNYYVEGIIPYLAVKEADFYVELGDIAYDKLDIFPQEKQATGVLRIPGYRVVGNHDLNFKSSGNKNSKDTFKKNYGPDYYSFDYGSFHYIILDNIIYKGWWEKIKAPGNHFGGLTIQQLKWLENDLFHVPTNKAIVLFSHIPLSDDLVTSESMEGLFKALKNHKKILAVSGHLHNVVAYDYTAEQGEKTSKEFEGLVAGAVCGSWWSGPLDINNIPVSTCTDGSPKGFFQLNVKNEDYNYVFNPVNYPADYQLRSYIINNEIWVNWFVGKRTDSVCIYIDNNQQAIYLENFVGKDPYMDSMYEAKKLDTRIKGVANTVHLWKAKLPNGLESGYHSIKIIARDSKGKLFTGFKIFLWKK